MAKTEYDVDDILPLVGEFSRFQIIIEVLFCIIMIPQSLQNLIMYFAGLNSPWRCAASSSVCTFPRNLTFDSESKQYKARCSMNRSDWEFVQSKDYSIVTQFDLYCDTEIYVHFTTSMFFIGWLIGAIVLGITSDRFGRLKTLFISISFHIIIGFMSAFSPNFWIFLASRFITGFSKAGVGVTMFIMASEYVGGKYRPMSGMLLWLVFGGSLVLLGVKAYFIRKWKTLFKACTIPYLFVIAFYRFVPESVRWLNLNNRKGEAMKILRKVAKTNGKELPDDVTLKSPDRKAKTSGNIIDLFRTKSVAFKTIVQFYAWMVFGMVYYGVALAAGDLGGKLYRDYILQALVEFPAIGMGIYVCNRFGRKIAVVPFAAMASIACILVAFIPRDEGSTLLYLRVAIGMIGKFGITVAFNSSCTWSVELHPTAIKSQAMGLLQIARCIGAAGAPWVAKGLNSAHEYAPFRVMGVSSLIASFLMIRLPETKGQKTAEVIEKAHITELEESVDNKQETKRVLRNDAEVTELEETFGDKQETKRILVNDGESLGEEYDSTKL